MAFRYTGGPHKLAESTSVTAYTDSSSTPAAAFTEQGVIRVVCITAAHIKISAGGGAATTSDMPVAANAVEYFLVDVGDQITAIRAAGSSNSNMHVTFCPR